MSKPELTHTLLITLALPDVYVEDLTEEALREVGWLLHDTDAIYDGLSLVSRTARLLLATGDKGGNELQDSRAVILSMDVQPRADEHDEPEDERLTEMIQNWCLWEAHRIEGEGE